MRTSPSTPDATGTCPKLDCPGTGGRADRAHVVLWSSEDSAPKSMDQSLELLHTRELKMIELLIRRGHGDTHFRQLLLSYLYCKEQRIANGSDSRSLCYSTGYDGTQRIEITTQASI